MKYNGKELIEMSPEKWDGNLRTMLVWDCVNDNTPLKARIVDWYKNGQGHVIWRDVSCKYWNYCAELPEEEHNRTQSIGEKKFRRMTNRELAKWIGEGKGEYKIGECAYSDYSYETVDYNQPVEPTIMIRSWNEDNWHEPLIEE